VRRGWVFGELTNSAFLRITHGLVRIVAETLKPGISKNREIGDVPGNQS
jgi:hypothetical protein